IDAHIAAINDKTKMICLVNPNNPTGTYYSKAAFEKLLKAIPEDVILAVDEAYVDFVDADDFPNSLNYRNVHKNTMVTRTFSKAFGISGIRLGYGIATAELVDYMNRVREPFNTSSLAQAAGIAALEDMDYLKKSVSVNKTGKDYYYQEFKRLGLEYLPTQGNFILVKLGENPAIGMECFNYLMKNGVIVRPMGGYGFPNWIRISIGLEDHNRICIEKLENFLSKKA
ncbi:MAG TPA: histidinol-phosphate transaminase, partial [bacterium]|nr:histidinol-phosphate transaminase [bacterium]